MNKSSEHISMLGTKVKDRVTGFKGIVTTISFDLYGCVQAVITSKPKDNNTKSMSGWYDVNRLEVLNRKPVMQVPNFERGPIADGDQGCAAKTLPGE
jgi:hypothetical protein